MLGLPFEVIREPGLMRERALDLRRDGRRIAVVPTMGSLHEGHLSLLRAARGAADVVVFTLFVNPTQFGPNEDLSRYPRDEAGDLAKARSCGVDLAFCPEPHAMYPQGHQTTIDVHELAKPLCGARRPGHFAGVATVVAKLFHLTAPHVAFFGEKDYQQLAIIRRMVVDLDFGIEIVGVPIVREPDGLALSSRNAYLDAAGRTQALSLSRALAAARTAFAGGERKAATLVQLARNELDAAKDIRLDYLELRDASDLSEIDEVKRPALLAVAAYVGTTRLIDNTLLT